MRHPLEPEYAWRGERGPSLFALVGSARVRLDGEGVRAAFGEIEATLATCVEGALRTPSWFPGAGQSTRRSIRSLLEAACDRLPRGRVALALSGGVDSAVLCAILRDRAAVYTLAPDLPDYGEEPEALAIARSCGVEVRWVRASEEDFVAALPDVIRACETPLYNLHPVSRHLLARRVRADGFDVLVTGDGADEAFAGRAGADYLPVVGAIVRAAGLAPYSPYLDPEVAPFLAGDRDKRALRALAVALGIPEAIALRPKRARLAPSMDLGRHADEARIAALARTLGRAPPRATDREKVGWTTLSLFAREITCVE